MRLHRLEVEGFGPFRARQVVDFDAFADDGIFLISGRTGAGKSSILDAVCFGLYGGVPRYDGGEKRLRSDHSEPDEPSEVVVEFSTPAGRFRVTRAPEYLRPAKRGGGMTKQAAAVSLDEWTDEGWVGRAARAVDVGNELDEILQLSREQFLQVILLAQNRFSEFLLAGSRDRQALLRRLFGTQRFEDVQARFDERRRHAEHELGTRLATVRARVEEAERLVVTAELSGDTALLGDTEGADDTALSGDAAEAAAADGGTDRASSAGPTIDERLERLRRARARAAYRSEQRSMQQRDAEQRAAAADELLSTTREELRAQRERDRARAAIDRLDAEQVNIDAAKTELSAARAAEALRSSISAVTQAQTAVDAAVDAERRVRAVWSDFEITVDGDLDEWASALTRESGSWDRARELETQVPALDVEVRAAEAAVSDAAQRVARGDAERASLPEVVAELAAQRDEERRLADRLDDLRAAHAIAETRRTAAGEQERLHATLAGVDRELTAVTADHADAQTTLALLRRRRTDGMAGELASTLTEGDACPVCGALEHPAPAAHTDPVSPDDIAAAEEVRDAAARRERELSDTAAGLRAELAASAARADGRTTLQAEEESREAAAALEHSRAAADGLEALETQMADLATRAEALEAERTHDAAALAEAQEQLALSRQRSTQAQDAIAEARGDFETVSARADDAAAKIAAARALAAAIAEVGRRAQAVVDAESARDAELSGSDFADAASAEQALRSSKSQEELEALITRHAVQREKERAILFDLEMLTLPEVPIDLAPTVQAAAAARALWTTAVDDAARAAAAAERLDGLIDGAATEHAATADAATEFEVLQGLADTIAGRGANDRKMTLETFVLAAELEEIVEAANRRLDDMSSGRYQLQHSDALAARGAASGLGIVVSDAFTGQTRPPQSLSGGETFLTSLALALGLAEVVTARAGGIRLDTLFIDEGFGSLDGDTLEVAMRTLDELRQGGRTVGVISHVEAMQEQIPAQLTVRALPNGPSLIEAP